jgi:hypothetical protein
MKTGHKCAEGKGSRLWPTLLVALLVTFAAGGCGARSASVGPTASTNAAYWTLSDRGIKSELIVDLKRAPQLLVIGGSRALRFDPAYIRRLTGLTAFNAAVQHATPQDEWCFVSLLHSRFPTARFQLLWVIDCDEFDQFSPGAALLEDPSLSRFLPPALVDGASDSLGPAAQAALAFGAQHPSVIEPDGFTVADAISADARRGTLRERVTAYIKGTLHLYTHTPARIRPQAAHYFTKTLALMNQLGVAPTVVLAPLQPWYLAAVYGRGWEARHRLVLAYLHHLQSIYRFNVLDFSRVSSIGGTSDGFYDAVHLRPETARLVVDAVRRLLPRAFSEPKPPAA